MFQIFQVLMTKNEWYFVTFMAKRYCLEEILFSRLEQLLRKHMFITF